jgi:tetraacyldisaccharide 4'-kinase
MICKHFWKKITLANLLLYPFSLLFRIIVVARKKYLLALVLPKIKINVPIIIVGNITFGGTGKTPLVIWLAENLVNLGFKPGIISRGYKGKSRKWPQYVLPNSDPLLVGDEPSVIAQRTGLPFCISPNRAKAAIALLEKYDCNVIVADDGLQHYALKRDLEIVIVDGTVRFGNKLCFPAGPLREPESRLADADVILVNEGDPKHEFAFRLVSKSVKSLNDNDELTISDFKGKTVHAVAGIGNPYRYFQYLKEMDIDVIEHAFPNHHRYKRKDLFFKQDAPILMTEKDAVKCKDFQINNTWYVEVCVDMHENAEKRINQLLNTTLSRT